MLNIVLFEPEIAENTANIGRTCNLTRTKLHLIRPFGFILDDKKMRRVGLDYWNDIDVITHDSFEDFLNFSGKANIYLATTHSNKLYTDVKYQDGDFIMFGSESKGVYQYVHDKLEESAIKIPIRDDSDRSLNLANSANIILYEALRQIGFAGME